MIAMIFEFWFDPKASDVFDEYLQASADVRQHLEGVEGFRGVERFQSCSDEGKFLAIGFFDDEQAVRRWRTLPEHRSVQRLGRTHFFVDYRLRMAEVVRDYGPHRREQAPEDSNEAHATAHAHHPGQGRPGRVGRDAV